VAEPTGHQGLTRHRLAVEEFDAIAAGHGDPAILRAGQLSRRMLLVQALASAAAERRPDLAVLADLDASLTLLRGSHRAHRAEVDRLLLHPQIGAWGMRCLRLLYGHGAAANQAVDQGDKARASHPPAGADRDNLAAQLGCFGTLAATAAMLVGRECEVIAHTLDGGLIFPTLGLATVEGTSGWVRIRVGPAPDGRGSARRAPKPVRQGRPAESLATVPRRVSLSVLSHGAPGDVLARFDLELTADGDGRTGAGTGVIYRAFRVPGQADPGSATPGWLPLRALVSEVDGRRLEVDLDDIDPFRSFHRVPPTPRLDDSELAVWHHRLDDAWELLVRHHPDRASTVASALASFIPLRSARDTEELSASCADAFGAMALTLPHSGLALAASLVHELAHSRLSALLDLVPLFEPDRRAVHYSPWRRDPRPVPGLTQGAFAFLALTDFWNVHRSTAGGAGGRLAQFEYARWRAELPGVMDTLTRSGVLTGLGEQFVGGMRRGLAAIADGAVPADAATLADLANAEHRITWRLRNVRPRGPFVAALGQAWRAGQPCPPLPASTAAVSTEPRGTEPRGTEPRGTEPRGTERTEPPAVGRAVAESARPDDLAPSVPRFVTHGRLRLSYLRLREPERFEELVREPVLLGSAAPDATPADLLLLTGHAAAAAAAYQDLILAQPDRLDLWAGLALSRRGTPREHDPMVHRPEVVLALYTHLRAVGTAPLPLELADWLVTAPDVYSGDGSNTKSTRTPCVTSRTSG
jgi:hypothetical protein